MIQGEGTNILEKHLMMLFLNVDKIFSYQKDVKKEHDKVNKNIDRKVISVSLVLHNLLVFLRSGPKWVNACKKIMYLFYQAFIHYCDIHLIQYKFFFSSYVLLSFF